MLRRYWGVFFQSFVSGSESLPSIAQQECPNIWMQCIKFFFLRIEQKAVGLHQHFYLAKKNVPPSFVFNFEFLGNLRDDKSIVSFRKKAIEESRKNLILVQNISVLKNFNGCIMKIQLVLFFQFFNNIHPNEKHQKQHLAGNQNRISKRRIVRKKYFYA